MSNIVLLGGMMDSTAGPNAYYDTAKIADEVSLNHHRELIGGAWDEIGKLQFDFLRANGLSPSSKLLDIGCGCLRGGVYFVEFLDPGNYYGMDISEQLLDAGYDLELKNRGLRHKLPRANLVTDGEFRFTKFPVTFDIAIAQSLFTHLPADLVRLCLSRLSASMKRGGSLFGTFFFVSENHPVGHPFTHPRDVQTFDRKDPYHYRFSQVERICEGLPWKPCLIGEWGHPRDQQMVRFQRL